MRVRFHPLLVIALVVVALSLVVIFVAVRQCRQQLAGPHALQTARSWCSIGRP